MIETRGFIGKIRGFPVQNMRKNRKVTNLGV